MPNSTKNEQKKQSFFAIKLKIVIDKNDENLLLEMMEKIRHSYNDTIAFLRQQLDLLANDPEFLEAKEKNKQVYAAKEKLVAWPLKNKKLLYDESHTKEDYERLKAEAKEPVKYTEFYKKYNIDGNFSVAKAMKSRVKENDKLPASIYYRSVIMPCIRAYEDYIKNISRKMQKKVKADKLNQESEDGKKKEKASTLSFKPYTNPVTTITTENGNTFDFKDGRLYFVLKSSKKYEEQVKQKQKGRGQGVKKGLQKREICIPQEEYTPYKIKALTAEGNEENWKKIKVVTIGYDIIRDKKQWYVSLIAEGIPPANTNHNLGCGKVGIDVGLSNAVFISKNEYRVVHFCTFGKNITEEKSSFKSFLEKKEKIMQEMCRLRIKNNPQRFDKEGKWLPYNKTMPKLIESNRYKKLKGQLQELERKTKAYREWSHSNQALEALDIGSNFIVEDNDFAQMAKRYVGLYKKENGEIESNAGFGKHIGRFAPALFVSILSENIEKRKGSIAKINPRDICATGYNHITNEITDIPLEQRWLNIGGHVLNRDGYAAFNLQHAVLDENSGKYVIDRGNCFKDFAGFVKLHDYYYTVLGTVEDKAHYAAAVRQMKLNKPA